MAAAHGHPSCDVFEWIVELIMIQSLLITGGAGFIGSHIADEMIREGWQVTIYDDLSSGSRENIPDGAELIVGDIRSGDLSTLIRERGFSAVSHHAAQLDVRRSVADPLFDAETNILAFIRMLEAIKEHPTTHVLFASSGGAIYGEPENRPCQEEDLTVPVSPYGCSKLAGEAYLRYYAAQYGIPTTIFRYANVYGPRQSFKGEAGVVAIFADKLLRDEPCLINGDGKQTRDYIFVKDVAHASHQAITRHITGTFNLGTGIETDVIAIHHLLAQALGRSSVPPQFQEGKAGEQRRSVIDPTLYLTTFQQAPMTLLSVGIRETAQWFLDRHAGRTASLTTADSK